MIKYTDMNVQTGYMMSLGSNLVLSKFDNYLPVIMIVIFLMKLLKITDRIIIFLNIDYCSEPIKYNLEHEDKIAQNIAILKSKILPTSCSPQLQ